MQIYAELINPKVGEDTDKIFDKISFIYRLANYKCILHRDTLGTKNIVRYIT